MVPLIAIAFQTAIAGNLALLMIKMFEGCNCYVWHLSCKLLQIPASCDVRINEG
jgi:hypothetical protein